VRTAFARPLVVAVDRNALELDRPGLPPASIPTAVARARIATRGTNVNLVVAVHGGASSRLGGGGPQALCTHSDRCEAHASERHTVHHERQIGPLGRCHAADATRSRRLARKYAAARTRAHQVVAPHLSADVFANVIVINRATNTLRLFDGRSLVRTFAVATGQAIYPTPAGLWRIVDMQRNPWWYPPVQDEWARGLKPVPPGPSNPLGTRWMGLNAPGVGIHGTDAPASIGYSASHGCVRMQVPEAEWLFEHVSVGTPVVIL
jgi:lipoprotein-anchoring transpeptidase ErfK/SrfK